MAAVLGHASGGSEAKVMFNAQSGVYKNTKLIIFIRQVRRRFNGDKVSLIWKVCPATGAEEYK
jgi:hypothetical protein